MSPSHYEESSDYNNPVDLMHATGDGWVNYNPYGGAWLFSSNWQEETSTEDEAEIQPYVNRLSQRNFTDEANGLRQKPRRTDSTTPSSYDPISSQSIDPRAANTNDNIDPMLLMQPRDAILVPSCPSIENESLPVERSPDGKSPQETLEENYSQKKSNNKTRKISRSWTPEHTSLLQSSKRRQTTSNESTVKKCINVNRKRKECHKSDGPPFTGDDSSSDECLSFFENADPNHASSDVPITDISRKQGQKRKDYHESEEYGGRNTNWAYAKEYEEEWYQSWSERGKRQKTRAENQEGVYHPNLVPRTEGLNGVSSSSPSQYDQKFDTSSVKGVLKQRSSKRRVYMGSPAGHLRRAWIDIIKQLRNENRNREKNCQKVEILRQKYTSQSTSRTLTLIVEDGEEFESNQNEENPTHPFEDFDVLRSRKAEEASLYQDLKEEAEDMYAEVVEELNFNFRMDRQRAQKRLMKAHLDEQMRNAGLRFQKTPDGDIIRTYVELGWKGERLIKTRSASGLRSYWYAAAEEAGATIIDEGDNDVSEEDFDQPLNEFLSSAQHREANKIKARCMRKGECIRGGASLRKWLHKRWCRNFSD